MSNIEIKERTQKMVEEMEVCVNDDDEHGAVGSSANLYALIGGIFRKYDYGYGCVSRHHVGQGQDIDELPECISLVTSSLLPSKGWVGIPSYRRDASVVFK